MAHDIPSSALARFWPRVDQSGGPDACWPWSGAKARGYGQISVNRKLVRTHRLAYEIVVGPIPAGMVLDHTCHTADPSCAGGDTCPHRACCNPAHLEPVTVRENFLRGRSLSALTAGAELCRRGHERNETNTRISTVGVPICLACERLMLKARQGRSS